MNRVKQKSSGARRTIEMPVVAASISAKRQELHLSQREATESKVLEAAVATFSEKGYALTTVNDIVERCGLSRGTFYLYYKDKGSIFKALVSEAVKDCYDIAPPSRDLGLRDRIRLSTRMHLERFAQHSGVLRGLFEASTLEPELGDLHNEYRAQFVHRIERHLQRASKAGLCRPLDPRVASYCLGCMIGGVTYIWLCARFEPWQKRQEMEPIVEQITEFWCRTLYVNV
jgi:AcrR family transcriptional regulator